MGDNKINIEIPFLGFYESIHDQLITDAIESGFNYDNENGCDIEISESVQDAIWRADVDYKAIFKEYAAAYADLLMDELNITGSYNGLWQPKEYNFHNDRIFCNVQYNTVKTIREAVYSHKLWPEYVKDNYTSVSGFISNYSNDYMSNEWLRDDINPSQWCSIIKFYITNIYTDKSVDNWQDLEYNLIDDIQANELESVNAAISVIDKFIFNQTNIKKLDNIENLFKKDIDANNLIIEIDNTKKNHCNVNFYVRYPANGNPSTDNIYKNKLIMARDIALMSSDEILDHLLINLIDRMRSSLQDMAIIDNEYKLVRRVKG